MNLQQAHEFAHRFSRGRDPFYIEGIDSFKTDNATSVMKTETGWAVGYRERGQFAVRGEYATEEAAAEAFLDALARLDRIPADWRLSS